MPTMGELSDFATLVLALWGVIALLGGPFMIMRIRKYFPERKEAVTPEQLRTELTTALDKMDFALRESFNGSVGRVQTALEMQHSRLVADLGELKESMRDAHRRASEAKQAASAADHKADLVQEKVTGLEKVMVAKLEHFETILRAKAG